METVLIYSLVVTQVLRDKIVTKPYVTCRTLEGNLGEGFTPGAFRNRDGRQLYHYVNWRLSRLSAKVTDPGMLMNLDCPLQESDLMQCYSGGWY